MGGIISSLRNSCIAFSVGVLRHSGGFHLCAKLVDPTFSSFFPNSFWIA
jgi:hypothetical protein